MVIGIAPAGLPHHPCTEYIWFTSVECLNQTLLLLIRFWQDAMVGQGCGWCVHSPEPSSFMAPIQLWHMQWRELDVDHRIAPSKLKSMKWLTTQLYEQVNNLNNNNIRGLLTIILKNTFNILNILNFSSLEC